MVVFWWRKRWHQQLPQTEAAFLVVALAQSRHWSPPEPQFARLHLLADQKLQERRILKRRAEVALAIVLGYHCQAAELRPLSKSMRSQTGSNACSTSRSLDV